VIIRTRITRRKHERRLRYVEPARDRLHSLIRQTLAAENDGQWIAGKRRLSEHIGEEKLLFHGVQSLKPRGHPESVATA
jgi:hypothetical protein